MQNFLTLATAVILKLFYKLSLVGNILITTDDNFSVKRKVLK